MINKKPNILLLGCPGSGKGTVAKQLVAKQGYLQLSTGDMFRETIKSQSELGKKVQALIASGNLVSDDITNQLIESYIVKALKDNQHFVLDGYPRTINQAQFLDKICKLDQVILLDCPQELAIKRISGRLSCNQCGAIFNEYFNPPKVQGVCDCCGGQLIKRKDDAPESALYRFSVYAKLTEPLINYYQKQGLLTTIKMDQDTDLYQEVLKVLK
ncbi:MAG: nucleoside monophosphate kinase [Mycoplasma sp.]